MSEKVHYIDKPCGYGSIYGVDTTTDFKKVTCKHCRKRIEVAMRGEKHNRRKQMDKIYEDLRQQFKTAGF